MPSRPGCGSLRVLELQAHQQVLQRFLELLVAVVLGKRLPQPRDGRIVVDVELLVAVGQVGVALIDGLFGGDMVGAVHRRLEQQVPEQEARERAVGGDGLAPP